MRIVRKAFSLIELLVCIAIISVLIALLLPMLKPSREKARLAVCSANLRSFSTIYAMYSGVYGDYPYISPADQKWLDTLYSRIEPFSDMQPPSKETFIAVWDCPSDNRIWQNNATSYTFSFLQVYVKNKEVWYESHPQTPVMSEFTNYHSNEAKFNILRGDGSVKLSIPK